jgi:hypothetical protein
MDLLIQVEGMLTWQKLMAILPVYYHGSTNLLATT